MPPPNIVWLEAYRFCLFIRAWCVHLCVHPETLLTRYCRVFDTFSPNLHPRSLGSKVQRSRSWWKNTCWNRHRTGRGIQYLMSHVELDFLVLVCHYILVLSFGIISLSLRFEFCGLGFKQPGLGVKILILFTSLTSSVLWHFWQVSQNTATTPKIGKFWVWKEDCFCHNFSQCAIGRFSWIKNLHVYVLDPEMI